VEDDRDGLTEDPHFRSDVERFCPALRKGRSTVILPQPHRSIFVSIQFIHFRVWTKMSQRRMNGQYYFHSLLDETTVILLLTSWQDEYLS
jgi:hypothetical protein